MELLSSGKVRPSSCHATLICLHVLRYLKTSQYFSIYSFRDEKTHRRDCSCKFCEQKFPSARVSELKKHLLTKCPGMTAESRLTLLKNLFADEQAEDMRHNELLGIPGRPMPVPTSPHYNQPALLRRIANPMTIVEADNIQSYPMIINENFSSAGVNIDNVIAPIANDSITGEYAVDVAGINGISHKRKFAETSDSDKFPDVYQEEIQQTQYHQQHVQQIQDPQSRILSLKSETDFLLLQWFTDLAIPFTAIDHPSADRLFQIFDCPKPTSVELSELYKNSTLRATMSPKGVYPAISSNSYDSQY